MTLRFIPAVLAAGALIAALAAAQPASAASDREKLQALIGTAATIYLLHELSKTERSKPKATVNSGHGQGRVDKGRGRGQGHGGEARRPPLPAFCIRDVRGEGRVLGARCLRNNYRAAHALPGRCRDRVWFKGRERSVYRIGCLRHRGYRISRS